MERQVGIAAYRRGEVRIVALRKPEVADRRRVVDRALHRPEDHHRERRVEWAALDRLEQLRKDVGIRDVPRLYAKAL